MKRTIHISLLLICCFPFSCVNNKAVSLSLEMAETMMLTQPDSALKILQSLHIQNIPKVSLQARYALLYTQALDKNYLPLSSNRLIDIAIDYFSRKKDYRKLGWSYLYLGNMYVEMDSLALAIRAYLKTQEILQRVQDDYLLGLESSEMASLHQEQGSWEEALPLLRQSLLAFQRAGNRRNEGYVLSQIADLLYESGSDIDSVQYYFNQAREIAIAEQDVNLLYILSISNAIILRAQKEYALAGALLSATVREYKQGIVPLECYPLLSALYIDLQQIDSARTYLQLLLHHADATDKQRVGALGALKELEEQVGNFQTALHYANQQKALSDSLLPAQRAHVLPYAEQQYRIERLISEKMLQKGQYMAIVLGITLLSAMGLLGVGYGWKRRMARQKRAYSVAMTQQQEALIAFKRTSLSEHWNVAHFIKEFSSKFPYRTEMAFFAKVLKTANLAYPGLIERLQKLFPQLNESDMVLICLLFSDLKPKEICMLYKVWNPHSLYTRNSRLYQKLGIKIDRKEPVPFRERLIDLLVMDEM